MKNNNREAVVTTLEVDGDQVMGKCDECIAENPKAPDMPDVYKFEGRMLCERHSRAIVGVGVKYEDLPGARQI